MTHPPAIEIYVPRISDDQVSHDLVWLTEHLMETQDAETSGGLLGGAYGYGAYYENDTFMMHPYCWCERDDCGWCLGCTCPDDSHLYFVDGRQVSLDQWYDAYDPELPDLRTTRAVLEKQCDYCAGRVERTPNFLHKSSGSRVEWYKYIGRGMEVDLRAEWRSILKDCVASLGGGA